MSNLKDYLAFTGKGNMAGTNWISPFLKDKN